MLACYGIASCNIRRFIRFFYVCVGLIGINSPCVVSCMFLEYEYMLWKNNSSVSTRLVYFAFSLRSLLACGFYAVLRHVFEFRQFVVSLTNIKF